jgi:hypothetical protein
MSQRVDGAKEVEGGKNALLSEGSSDDNGSGAADDIGEEEGLWRRKVGQQDRGKKEIRKEEGKKGMRK